MMPAACSSVPVKHSVNHAEGVSQHTGAPLDAQAADPVRVRIPSVAINAAVMPLHTDSKGVLPPPKSWHKTGWWQGGPEPGERGPAVIVGHVDSYRGPAVFFRLHTVHIGARIFVDRADSTTATFTVERMKHYEKSAFPTRAVYGDTPGSELRLITCGGTFDYTKRRYLANLVVFARRVR